MAVQLGHPQEAYVCDICSFTSLDHKVLVKHLVDHKVIKEKKHEHILWCGLCRPLTGVNPIDGHQQAMTNHLNESMYHDSNDLSYGDTPENYYSEYNGLYNPYAFSSTYYYPMNIAYRNPCYGDLNGYYQTQNTIFYTDDFYDGNDIFPTLNTPRFIEPAPENKYLLDAPHNLEKTQDSCSTRSLTMSFPDFRVHSNYSNSVNYDSSVETPVDPHFSDKNFPNKSGFQESTMGTFSRSIANGDLNVVQSNEFGTILNIEPQPRVNESSIQPASDINLRKFSGSQLKNLSSKSIPETKPNTVEQNSFQKNVRKADDSETIPKVSTESSNLEFLSETNTKSVDSSTVDSESAIKKKSINMNTNTQDASAPKEIDYSKLPSVKVAEPFETDANASFTEENFPVSFPEASQTEKIIMNDSWSVKNCSINVKNDTLSKTTLRKKSNADLHTCEREASSEIFLGKGSIPNQDENVVSDAESSPEFHTIVLAEDSLDIEAGSIDVNGPLTKIDLNEIHSEQPTGKFETSPKIQNSVLSGNDSLVSAAEFSPKLNAMIVRENSVSNIKIPSMGMNGDPKTKNEVVDIDKGRAIKNDPGRMKLEIGIHVDSLNRNLHRENKGNSTEAVTKSSKKSQRDKTGAPNVGNCLRNSGQGNLNRTNKICTDNPAQAPSRSYSEVLKHGLFLKSSS